MPQIGLVWPAWLDVRALIVSVGVLIVVADVLVRRMHREKAVAGPAEAELILPQPERGTLAPQFRSAEETPAGDVGARATDAVAPSIAPSLPDRPSIVVLPFANMTSSIAATMFV